jgi:hypothetical protein
MAIDRPGAIDAALGFEPEYSGGRRGADLFASRGMPAQPAGERSRRPPLRQGDRGEAVSRLDQSHRRPHRRDRTSMSGGDLSDSGLNEGCRGWASWAGQCETERSRVAEPPLRTRPLQPVQPWAVGSDAAAVIGVEPRVSRSKRFRRANAVDPTATAPTIANSCRQVSEGIPKAVSPRTR